MALSLPTEPILLLFLAGYLATSGISAVFVLYVVRYRRDQPAARAFAGITLLITLWGVAYVGRMLSPTVSTKLFWTQLAWIPITLIPVSILVFGLVFTGRPHLLSRTRIGLLAVVPFLTQAMLLTNDAHWLLYEDVGLYTADSIPLIASTAGPWFYAVHMPYVTGIYALGTALLVHFALATAQIYRTQVVALLVGVIVPWVVNVTYLAGVRLHPELDPTPIGVGVGMAAIGLAVLRVDFLGLIPLARERVVDEMDDCIFVLDDADRLVDCNAASELFLDRYGSVGWSIGEAASDVFPSELAAHNHSDDARVESELRVSKGDLESWYLVRRSRLGESAYRGSVLALTDISTQKHQQQSLERTESRLRVERDGKEAIRRLLLQTATVEDIAENACRLLVEVYGYEAVWIVEQAGAVQDRAAAGRVLASYGQDHGFRDRLTTDDARNAVTGRTLETAAPVSVTVDMADEGTDTVDRETVENLYRSGLYSMSSFPLAHNGVLFGAITATRTEQSDGLNSDMLTAIAEALAFKQEVHTQREALTTETVLELGFRITADHVLLAVTAAASIPNDAPLVVHELARGNTQVTYLLESTACDGRSIEEAAAEIATIDSVERLSEADEPTALQLRIHPPTISTILSEYGGTVQSFTVQTDRVDVTAQLPVRTDVRAVADALRTHWPETVLRSQQERVEKPDRQGAFEILTDKQEAALRAAVVLGFFERPQRATATDVARTLDVSSSTFLHHLRTAERKVFGDAFQTEQHVD